MSSRHCQEVIFVEDAREEIADGKTVEDQGCGRESERLGQRISQWS